MLNINSSQTYSKPNQKSELAVSIISYKYVQMPMSCRKECKMKQAVAFPSVVGQVGIAEEFKSA